MQTVRLISLFACLFPFYGWAQVTVYQGATLIDGTLSGVTHNAVVVVSRDRITAVGPAVEIPADAQVVDVSGKWIVPGLIDAHIHFMTSGRMYTRPAFFDLTDKVPYEEEMQWIRDHVPQTLTAFMCSGVTGVVSLGGPSLEYNARALAAARPDAPTVFVGHGAIAPIPRLIAENIIPAWDGEMTVKPATSAEDAHAIVAAAVSNNADLIKTALDDRGSWIMGRLISFFGWREMQQAIVETAADHGLRVTTHAHALEYARSAVQLGAASLQHIPADEQVDASFIQLVKDRQVITVPTLAIRTRTFVELVTKELDILPIERACSVPGVVASWSEPVPATDEIAENFARQRVIATRNAKTLYEQGARLAVGTDSGMIGLAAGSSMHLELRELRRAGIPADYLIHAATLNSARLVGREADYGTVEAGKFADFLILAADPLDDIGNLQQIEAVVKSGRRFAQEQLLPGRHQASLRE